MLRAAIEAVALFLLPFVLYGFALLIRPGYRFLGLRGGGRFGVLTLLGLGCVLLGLLVLGVVAPRHQGAYVPAHLKDGRLVPGEIR